MLLTSDGAINDYRTKQRNKKKTEENSGRFKIWTYQKKVKRIRVKHLDAYLSYKKNFIIQVLFVEVQTKGRYFLYFCSFVSSTHTMRTHTFTSRCHCKQKANGAKRSKAKKGFNAWQIQQHQEFLNLLFFLFSWCARAVVAPVDSLLRKPKLDLHF